MSAEGEGGYSREALRFGTEAHYEDAERYDRTYRRRRDDVGFYRSIAAELGGPILELGAGTGRISIPLARDGHRVIALERMAPMIEKLRARLLREPRAVRERVEIVCGDLRCSRGSASVGARASRPRLVFAPFNVLMHLYTAQEFDAMLACVRAELAPGGRFVFDVRMPDLRSLVRDPDRAYGCARLRDPHDGSLWDVSEHFEYDADSQVQMITSVFREVGPPHRVTVRPLAHRQFFPQELELLLERGGFSIVDRWGDFQRGPTHVDAESQIIVARARRPRR